MLKHILIGFFLLVVFSLTSLCINVSAISETVVISEIQTQGLESPYYEYVKLFNNTSYNVEITNWCIQYVPTSGNESTSARLCVVPDDEAVHVFMPAMTPAFFVSNQLATGYPALNSDGFFSFNLSNTAGHLKLYDDDMVEVDKVGWGSSAVLAEGLAPAPAPSTGSIISRKADGENILIDTDNNFDDFEILVASTTHESGYLYEVIDLCLNVDGIQEFVPNGMQRSVIGVCELPILDYCPNISGEQIVMPDGYYLDEYGDCIVDVCLNLDGLQAFLPDGMKTDEKGDCQKIDSCLNLDGLQEYMPYGYESDDDMVCSPYLQAPNINELLPNPEGGDDGNEYVEIYNPNTFEVELDMFSLVIEGKKYSFPEGAKLLANGYFLIRDSEVSFTLVNTGGRVWLESIDGLIKSEVSTYINALEGESWGLVDGLWQFSNQLTPGLSNLPSFEIIDPEIIEQETLKPCPVGQYRNPETNRCRLIVQAVSTLAPCKEGQYRSEETNRCRNIVTDVVSLMPCDEGEERNPETNRCRKIVDSNAVLSASTLAPCPEGQERNPDTNRCRKVISEIPTVDYAPIEIYQSSRDDVAFWSLVGVGSIGVGYGLWEWRQEFKKLFEKAKSFFNNKK